MIVPTNNKREVTMNTALFLISFQNDHSNTGRIPLEKFADASAKAQIVQHAFREKNYPLFISNIFLLSLMQRTFYLAPKALSFIKDYSQLKMNWLLKNITLIVLKILVY